MTEWKRKRFWTEAAVQAEDDGFTVALDGRVVQTPAKTPLHLPTRAMAEAVAQEWDAQEGEIDPLSMPVTRSANAALDKVVPQSDEVIAMLAEYGDADLLCYRAEAPAELVRRQAEAWDPALDWAAETYGARLIPVQGVLHRPQDARVLARLRAPLEAMSAFRIAAMHDLISLSGSLVLGLAASEGWRDPEAVWRLSRLDEDWQEEQWGIDEEAAAQAAHKRAAFLHAKRFFDLA
ncbi:MAG TPA: ATPase [Rhodobacteraceae bacterium]|nr:ATPase [Paracoccaceae bacterium]